jgi:hypothetical protein
MARPGYYQRSNLIQLDGTVTFMSAADRQAQKEVAELLEVYFSEQKGGACQFIEFGLLSAVDWYVVRYGRVVGLAELKRRYHSSTEHPTVFLSVRKWMALTLAAMGMGVPALFAVRFDDGLFYIWNGAVDARRHAWRGCVTIVKHPNDIEPVIEIPVQDMTRVLVTGGEES